LITAEFFEPPERAVFFGRFFEEVRWFMKAGHLLLTGQPEGCEYNFFRNTAGDQPTPA
tara:strand:- start:742 stop:915 length:174 start_codon:yes stop_codon:yes gene_type:complete